MGELMDLMGFNPFEVRGGWIGAVGVDGVDGVDGGGVDGAEDGAEGDGMWD